MASKDRTKITLLLLAAFLLLVGVGFSYFLNQPKFLADTALYFLKKSPSDIIFKEITLESLHWNSWQSLSVQNLRIKFKMKGDSYFVSAGDVRLDDLRALLSDVPLRVHVQHVAIVSDSLNISDLQLQGHIYFSQWRYQKLETSVQASRLEYNQYLVEHFKGDFKDQTHRLEILNSTGNFYGGHLGADGWVSYLNPLTYVMNLKLKNIDSILLAKVNPSFAQVTAVVSGTVKAQDLKGEGLMVQADVKALSGGSIKASLLRYLAQYVPQRQQVEDLIRKDANVQLSKAQMTIVSLDSQKISSEVILNSSSLNLNMDVKFDINIDGGINGLLEYIH